MTGAGRGFEFNTSQGKQAFGRKPIGVPDAISFGCARLAVSFFLQFTPPEVMRESFDSDRPLRDLEGGPKEC